MSRQVALTLGLVAVLLWGTSAHAAFVFGVDSTLGPLVAPGSSGNLTVFLDNTGPGTGPADTVIINLNAAAGNGASLADLTVLGPVALASGTPFNQFFSQNNSPPTSFTFSANSLPASALPVGRTDLFVLPFTVSNTAPANGTFSFDIVPGTIFPTGLYNNNVSLGATYIDPGADFTMVVSAVPEPASLGFGALALAGLGGAARRFRRRPHDKAVDG